MRQYLFFVILTLFFVPVSVQTAQAKPVREVDKAGIYDPINKKQDEENEENMEDRKKASEQASNDEAASREQQGNFEDANNINATKRSQEEAMVNTNGKYLQIDEYNCSWPSVSQSMSAAKESAEQAFETQLQERLKIISGEAGAQSENGLVDFQNQLYDQMHSMDHTRFSLGDLLMQRTIPTSGVVDQKLEYVQNMLYARVPVYLNKDLEDSADTETKNLLVQADRLRSEMAIGQSVFSMLKSNRASNKGNGKAIQFQKEVMQANGYSGQYVQKLLTPDASYRAQLEAMIVGQFGKDYMMEKFVTNPENYGGGILWNLMLNNLIQFENYRLLEAIAVATSTNVIAVREEAINNTNARIARKNARQ